jgi:hypothetical protein
MVGSLAGHRRPVLLCSPMCPDTRELEAFVSANTVELAKDK